MDKHEMLRLAGCMEATDLPEVIKEEISNATPYVEGRGIALDINNMEET